MAIIKILMDHGGRHAGDIVNVEIGDPPEDEYIVEGETYKWELAPRIDSLSSSDRGPEYWVKLSPLELLAMQLDDDGNTLIKL